MASFCMLAFMHAQLCPTLCDPRDCSLPRTSVHGILQAKILDWVVISFSKGSSRPTDWINICWVSCIDRQMLPLRPLGSPILLCVCVCVCVCVCLVAQSCQTLCHPMNCSPPGFSVHEISQAIMLEWVAILFSGGSSWPLGLLLCRQILYWLSHQRSPLARTVFFKDLVSLCLSSLLCLSW